MHTWTDAEPYRLVEKQVTRTDPEAKALACYGLYLPTTNQMHLRFVESRPISAVTCVFLAWLADVFTQQGKRALFLIWDNATWHNSQAVRRWLKAHNRLAKQHGTCRLIIMSVAQQKSLAQPD